MNRSAKTSDQYRTFHSGKKSFSPNCDQLAGVFVFYRNPKGCMGDDGTHNEEVRASADEPETIAPGLDRETDAHARALVPRPPGTVAAGDENDDGRLLDYSDIEAIPEGEPSTSDGPNPDGNGATEDGEPDADPELPLVAIVEAVLFAARDALKLQQIARAAGKGVRQEAVRTAIDELNLLYLETSRAFEIAELSGKFQLMSKPEYVEYIMRLYPKRGADDRERVSRLTPAALDALSIIAYKQPVTRGEIEHIRGVGCGPVLRALIERGTVRVAGKRTDLVGQPLMYGTTDNFLVEFGLGSLDELPLRNEFLTAFADIAANGASTAAASKKNREDGRGGPEAASPGPSRNIGGESA